MAKDFIVDISGKDNLSGTISKIKKELSGTADSASKLDVLQLKFDKIERSTAPLQRKMKQLTDTMAQMQLDGLDRTDVYQRMAAAAAGYADAIGDARGAQRLLSSDTAGFDAAISGMLGIAAAGSVATGVMSLLGTKNQDVERALLKVQSAMAIANGLQQISNVLNKDGILMLKLKQTWLNITTATTASETAAKTANTVATTTNTVATGASTVAQNAWNIAKAVGKALLGDFTGLLLVGVAGLAAYAIATDNSTDADEKKAKSSKDVTDALKDEMKAANASIAQYNIAISKLRSFKGSKEEEKKIVDEMNRTYGDTIGYYNSVNEWYEALIKNSKLYCDQMIIEAKIRAKTNQITNLENEKYDYTHNDDGSEKDVNKMSGKRKTTFWTNREIKGSSEREQYQSGLNKLNTKGANLLGELEQLIQQSMANSSKLHTGSYEKPTTKNGGKSGKSTTSKDNKFDANKELKDAEKTYSDALIKIAHNKEAGLITEKEANNKLIQAEEQAANAYVDTAIKAGGFDKLSASQKLTGEQHIQNVKDLKQQKFGIEVNENIKKAEDEYAKQTRIAATNLAKQLNDKEQFWADHKSAEQKIIDQYISEADKLGGICNLTDEKKKALEEHIKALQEATVKEKIAAAQKEYKKESIGFNAMDNSTKYSTLKSKQQESKELENNISFGIDVEESTAKLNLVKQQIEDLKEMINFDDVAFDLFGGDFETTIEQFKQLQEIMDSNASGGAKAGSAMVALGENMKKLGKDGAAAKVGAVLSAVGQLILGFAAASALAASMGPWVWIGFVAAGLATVAATIASIKSYATGGIIKGAYSHGDQLMAKVNAGEMILNGTQQQRLFNILDGNEAIGGFNGGNVTFELHGEVLKGAITNYDKKISRF